MAMLKAAVLISGIIPVLNAIFRLDTTLLIYSVFVAVWSLRPHIGFLRGEGLSRSAGIVIATIFTGWIAEVFAWTSNYLSDAQKPALLSPQLLPDLFLAVGYYGGWAAAWIVTLRRYRFSLGQAFAVTGVMGVFAEQSGGATVTIINSLPTSPLLSLLLTVYIFAVYGSIIATAFLLAGFESTQGRDGGLRFILVVLAMLAASTTFTLVASYIGAGLGVVHQPMPIRPHPLF